MTLNRGFTPAEAEHMREVASMVAFAVPGEKMRVTTNRIWYESRVYDSRTMYAKVAELVAASFVNMYPLAVRTFRELIPSDTKQADTFDMILNSATERSLHG